MVTEPKFALGAEVIWKRKSERIPARIVGVSPSPALTFKEYSYLISVKVRNVGDALVTDYHSVSEKELE